MSDLLDQLRAASRAVAEKAAGVWVNDGVIEQYARALDLTQASSEASAELRGAPTEHRAAFWLTLDAINFGSGWFPTLRKRRGQSGYHTLAAGLRDRFAVHGPWSADQLAALGEPELAETLGQDTAHELIGLYSRSLRDLGAHVLTEHDGSFARVVGQAGGSASELVELLAGWECFADTSDYDGIAVPFLKRAQIAAADLERAGVAEFKDLARLTMFADNLVPHVLRLDGVLEYDPELVARIERGELIEHGSREEIEIRACALHAVELIVEAREDSYAAQIDQVLWERGAQARYKAVPRHRSRCTAY